MGRSELELTVAMLKRMAKRHSRRGLRCRVDYDAGRCWLGWKQGELVEIPVGPDAGQAALDVIYT